MYGEARAFRFSWQAQVRRPSGRCIARRRAEQCIQLPLRCPAAGHQYERGDVAGGGRNTGMILQPAQRPRNVQKVNMLGP